MPLAAAGVSGAISLYSAYKARQQQAKLQAPLGATAAQQQDQSKQLFGAGLPLVNQAGSYYRSLLGGSRAAMTQAIQPETTALADTYGGAARGLKRQGVQGANRDVAKADLSRDLAGKVGGLIASVRPGAAQASAALGTAVTGSGVGATGSAAGAYGSLLGLQQQQNQFNTGQTNMDWSAIGTMLTNMLRSWRTGQNTGSITSGPSFEAAGGG